MEHPSNFLARYAPSFICRLAGEPRAVAVDADRIIRTANAATSVMPDWHDLYLGSQQRLGWDIWRLREEAAPLNTIREKESWLHTIQQEARVGDAANHRLARTLATAPG
jgi:hypothetical protein